MNGVAIGKSRVARRQGTRTRRPMIELMEDRVLLATFTVTNNADSGPGSLRQAILNANTAPGKDTINFNIKVGAISEVAIPTPNGKIRSLLIRDPDGYVIEVVESTPAQGVKADGNVFGASMGLTVADMESTIKFWNGLLGFDLKGNMEFSSDPAILKMTGAAGAKNRELVANVPGTKALLAFYEYQGIARTAFHLRVPDPGAPAVALRVTDIDGLLKRLRAAGVPVTSAHGEIVQFTPAIRNIFVEDPNGLNIELFEVKQ